MYVSMSPARSAVDGVPPAPNQPLTDTPAVTAMPIDSALAVGIRVEERVIAPVTETVPEPSEARAEAAVPVEHALAALRFPPFMHTSARDVAEAPATKIPAASAVALASGRSVAIDVTDRLAAPVTLPSM